MKNSLRTAALALTLPSLMAVSLPATAAPASHGVSTYSQTDSWDQYRNRYPQSQYGQGYYGEPVYANTRVWRGDDGRYYCKKKNGTTGLIIGGAAGALLGRSIAGRGDNTLGTILGAAGGALLGREIARSSSSRRCR